MGGRDTRRASPALAGACALIVAAGHAAAGERSFPIDCFPDRVVAFEPVAANPQRLFGAAFMPGIVLGPPGDSEPYQGALTVATLGFGGSITLAFDDVVIEDGPGPDFVVFENPFFKLPLPVEDGDAYKIFAEPAFVEVSANGVDWFAFPHDARALAAASGVPEIDAATFVGLGGLAGSTPTFTGNWTLPDDRSVFDPDGVGGVSGAGGDAFDLADVGLAEARYLRFTDANTQNGFPGPGEGFDLDAVIALHARPASAPHDDRDGDGLGDLAEERMYGSDPDNDDTDGDGIDDGREVATCRDAGAFGDAIAAHRDVRLWVAGSTCTEARWSFAGSGLRYDLVRGTLRAWHEDATKVSLDAATCLVAAHTQLRWGCDATTPQPGTGHYFLARVSGESAYGRSSQLNAREALDACP